MNKLPNVIYLVSENNASAVKVSFQFEEGVPYSPSVIETMAKAAMALVKQNPLAVSEYAFFDAAKAGDWFSGKVLLPNSSLDIGLPQQKHHRLKAIKLGNEILLEHGYRPDGRLGSTKYLDGEMVSYEWDDLNHNVRARSKSGRDTLVKLRADDLVESVIYEGNQRFQYEFDLSDRPCRLNYPDGVCSQRLFGQKDELVSASVGGVSSTFRWTTDGNFEGCAIKFGSVSHDVRGKDRKLECDFSASTKSTISSQSSPVTVSHPLGVWRITQGGSLEEMVTPWGDRFSIQAYNQGRPAIAWSPRGRHAFDYNPAGALSAITHPDGSRSMIHPLKDQPKAIMVSPNGVTLLEYDDDGRLQKSRDGDGGYCLYEYSRSGSPKGIETLFDTLKLVHDKANRLASVKFANGSVCKFVRAPDGTIRGLTVDGLGTNALGKIQGLLVFLWQWMALHPTLRLEALSAGKGGSI